jgi:hypothetical protein
MWSRLGNEKTSQFPEIVTALTHWGRTLRAPIVLDGEIVALDDKGEPAGFQQLQGRIHLLDPSLRLARPELVEGRARSGQAQPSVAYIAFDLLRDDSKDWRDRPLLERRAALEQVFKKRKTTPIIRLSTMVRGDGRALYEEASAEAGRPDRETFSPRSTSRQAHTRLAEDQDRSRAGIRDRRLTEPRQTRTYFGALLLGVYQGTRPSMSAIRYRLQQRELAAHDARK